MPMVSRIVIDAVPSGSAARGEIIQSIGAMLRTAVLVSVPRPAWPGAG